MQKHQTYLLNLSVSTFTETQRARPIDKNLHENNFLTFHLHLDDASIIIGSPSEGIVRKYRIQWDYRKFSKKIPHHPKRKYPEKRI